MDLTAPHLGFVYGAYALSAILIVGLVIYVVGRDRSLRAEVARLEKTGDRHSS
jgi:heme exporter protein CcmD